MFQKRFFRIVVNSAGRKEKMPANYLLIFLIFYYGNKCNFPGTWRRKKGNSPLDVCVSIILMQERCLVQGTLWTAEIAPVVISIDWLEVCTNVPSYCLYSLIKNKQKSVINRIPNSLLYAEGICPDNVPFF